MARRKRKGSNPLMNFLSLVCVVVAIVLWFSLSPIQFKETDATVSYVNGTFGYSEDALVASITVLKFSIVNLIPLILMILMGVALATSFLLPKKISNNSVKAIVILLSLVSIVLLAMFKNFVIGATGLIDYTKYSLTIYGLIVPVLLLGASVIQLIKK